MSLYPCRAEHGRRRETLVALAFAVVAELAATHNDLVDAWEKRDCSD